jgi:hypothetical protein
MNDDIRHAMKLLALYTALIIFGALTASGQSQTGVLRIFSENPLVVYVDEVHYPQYGEIRLVPGTHWVKAINGEGIRVYSQIVSVKSGEVTSVLIEAPQSQSAQNRPAPAQAQPGQTQSAQSAQVQPGHTQSAQSAQAQPPGKSQSVVYGQAANGSQPDQSAQATQPGNGGGEPENVAAPRQTIDIGQTGGRLPADMSGAFGMTFGMSMKDVDQLMSPKAAQAQRSTGYSVYAIPHGSSVYIVECRFIDQKLFQIIVGYVSTSINNSKLKLSKGEIPVPEFGQMLNDITAIYGSPATAEKIFLAGYTEDDGRLLEALKRKKALYLYTWTDPATGNNVMVGLGYTTAPLAATIYTSGPMSAEAASRKLKLHAYEYHKSFKDNYFSN